MAKAMQPQKLHFSQAMQTEKYKNLINNTLGDPVRAARFAANITSAVAVNPTLQECDAGTILAGALLGESLLLQPSPQLGQFYLVPFKSKAKRDRQGNVIEPACLKAQFVLGYKGYIQLALRTGQYKRLNVLEIKSGELGGWDPFEERFHEMHFIEDFEKRAAMPTVGYIAHFEYINGFEKTLYWTADQMMSHADKYSPAFSAAAYKKLLNGEIPQEDMWKYSSFWYRDKHPAHRGLCFSRKGEDVLEICALDGYRMAIARINCTADGDFRFTLPAATAKAVDTLSMDGSVEIVRDRKKAVFSDSNFEVKSRLIAEPFLDYGKVVAQRNEGTRIALDRKELLGVLGRVKLARSADAKEKSVLVMDLEPGGTGRASMRSTIAQMNEEFSFSGKLEDPLRIGFNLEFLSEALKSMEEDEVSAWVVGPLSPVKLIEPQYEALVLPVKVRGEA